MKSAISIVIIDSIRAKISGSGIHLSTLLETLLPNLSKFLSHENYILILINISFKTGQNLKKHR
jgi:hypothetical protein